MMTAMQLIADEENSTAGKQVEASEPKGKKGKKQKKADKAAEAAATNVPPNPALGVPLFVFDTPEEAQKRVAVLQANRPNDQISMSEMDDGKFAIFAKPKTATETSDVTTANTPSATTPSGTPDVSTAAGSAALPAVGGGTQPGIENATPDQTGLGTSSGVTGQPVAGAGVQPSALAPLGQPQPDQTSQITPDQIAAAQQQEQQRVQQEQQRAELQTVHDETTKAFDEARAAYDLARQSDDPKAVWTAADQYEKARDAFIKSRKALGITEAEQEEIEPTDPEAEAATSALTKAADNVINIDDARKEKREKGKGEPAIVRRSKRDADKMLESAISGKSGLINVIQKLQTELAAAEAALQPYGGVNIDPEVLKRRGAT